MAIPEPHIGLVRALAARVTNPDLVSFHGFMRLALARWFAPVVFGLAATASAGLLIGVAPTVRAACGTASSAPCPTPTPTVPQNAFLSLDLTSGDTNSVINVTGGQFLPNEQTSLYWDQPNKVAGSATADAGGNFNVRVKPFSGDQPGVHRLCASVAPSPCANFTLNAAAATPSPTPTPVETPTPSPQVATPARIDANPSATTLSGWDVISKPPFVFLPLIGLAAIAVSLGYWILGMVRRPRPVQIRSAAVVHRAMRPDYSAGFGTPPPAPASPAPEASAWGGVESAPPFSASYPPAPAPAAPAPQGPPPDAPEPIWSTQPDSTEWGTGTPDSGYQFAPPEIADDEGDIPTPGD